MRLRQIVSSIICIFIAALATDVSASTDACEKAKTRDGLTEYVVDAAPDEDGDAQIEADFDGDGVVDKLLWFSTGSASIIPADNSSATVTLSSTGKNFIVEDQHVLIAKYANKYYIMTSSVDSGKGPWHRTVYSVNATGISKLCSFSGKGISP